LNRRRFLKYAGVGAAVVGASALGLDYLLSPQLAIRTTSSTSSLGTTTTSSSLTSSSLSESSLSSTLSSATSSNVYNRLSFFFDPNLNGKKDQEETILTNLKVTRGGIAVDATEGTILVEKNSTVDLWIEGTAPNGKPLTTYTAFEPHESRLLPHVRINSLSEDFSLGLADGCATSPIKPSELIWEPFLVFNSIISILINITLRTGLTHRTISGMVTKSKMKDRTMANLI
jgi:hypothetical protein